MWYCKTLEREEKTRRGGEEYPLLHPLLLSLLLPLSHIYHVFLMPFRFLFFIIVTFCFCLWREESNPLRFLHLRQTNCALFFSTSVVFLNHCVWMKADWGHTHTQTQTHRKIPEYIKSDWHCQRFALYTCNHAHPWCHGAPTHPGAHVGITAAIWGVKEPEVGQNQLIS